MGLSFFVRHQRVGVVVGDNENGDGDREDKFVRSLFPCYEMTLDSLMSMQFDLVYFAGFSYNETEMMSGVDFRFFYRKLREYMNEKIYPNVISYMAAGDKK